VVQKMKSPSFTGAMNLHSVASSPDGYGQHHA
jgi:hypothetical protein